MRSFAGRARDTLTRQGELDAAGADARRAELTGLVLSCGSMTLAGQGRVRLVLRTGHAGTGRRIVRLLRQDHGAVPQLRILRAARLGGRTTFEIRLDADAAARVLAACELSPLELTIPRHCQRRRHSREAFLRGVFLGCGTMADPERGYQMDFALSAERTAISLVRFLRTYLGVAPGLHQRKGQYVVYLKGSDDIIQVLSCIGAHAAILDYENVRIMKDARNRANRAANCDSGNITKMLGAADRQLRAIDAIEARIGLDALPQPLREIALLRRQHADITLEELGEMLDPPVGKSGVHHRLKRLEALARSFDEENT